MCDCFCNLAVSSVGSIAHNARKEVTICSSADSCRCLHWRRKEKAEQSDFWRWTGRPWELGFSCPLSTSEQKLPDPSAFPATSLQWGPMTTNCCINSTHGMSRFPISLSFNPILLSLKFRCSHCLTTIVFFLLTILLLSTHFNVPLPPPSSKVQYTPKLFQHISFQLPRLLRPHLSASTAFSTTNFRSLNLPLKPHSGISKDCTSSRGCMGFLLTLVWFDI